MTLTLFHSYRGVGTIELPVVVFPKIAYVWGYSQWTSMKKTSQTNLANDRRRMHGGDEGCIAGILRKKCLKDARKESTWKD